MKKPMCPNCGSRKVRRRRLKRYPYRESGLTNVVLMNGAYETVCEDCREKTISIPEEWQLLQVIALTLLMKPAKLAGSEMRFIRGACALSQAELARRLHIRRETVAEREAKTQPGLKPGDDLMLRLVLLRAFQEFLREGHDHLSPGHKEALEKFTCALVDFAGNLFTQTRREIRLRQRKNRWEPESKLMSVA